MRRYLFIFLAAGIGVIAIGPAPTSITQTYSISGRILIECRGNHDGVIVWIDLDHRTETDAQGDYAITNLPDGEYVVRAWSENCLARIVDTIQITGADVTGVNDTLFAWDVTEDGRINLLDAGAILAAYRATPDSAAWDAVLDIDVSGVIDSLDIAALMVHWKERSDSPLPPMDIVVIEPAGTTTWYLGEQDVPIRWETGNLGGEVSLSLFRGDELIEWIIYATPNDGSHTAFDVPTHLEPGTDYRVRVYYDGNYHAFSDYFEIRHYFDVTEPASSTMWYLNEQNVSIVWEDPGGLGGDVSIILYRDDVQVGVISDGTPNNGSYDDYDVPPDLSPGLDYWLGVYHDGGHFGYSDRFEIRSDDIVVIEPDSATTWYPGARDVPIRWETGNLGGDVSIVFLRGNDNIATIASPTPNDGAYDEYDVPTDLEPASDYRIWIHRDAGHYDYSDYFGVGPYLFVIEPTEDTKWYINQENVPIRWESGDSTGDVSLILCDGYTPTDTIVHVTPNDGRYDEYNVPPELAPHADYRVFVQHDQGYSAYSAGFEVLPDYIVVNDPDSTTTWHLGAQDVPIRWNTGNLGGNVQIDLYRLDDPVVTIAEQTPNDGAYADYDIPEDMEAAADYRIRVYLDENNYDYSDNFEIRQYFTVTAPDENTTWIRGQIGPVRWEPVDLGGYVEIMLNLGDELVSTIAHRWQNNGNFPFYNVPYDLTPGTDYRIRITHDNGVFGYSGRFEIRHEGYEWIVQNPHAPLNHLRSVSFTSADTGTAVGEFGTILRTTDAGATWNAQTSGTSSNLNGIWFVDAYNGTAVGESGGILQTTDGGKTWAPRTSGTAVLLRDVWFSDANTGTAVGDNGTILRTSDGGITWNAQTSGTDENLYAVSFAGPDTGTVVGAGVILRTTDSGTTWSGQTGGEKVFLQDVFLTDGETGTIVGFGGRILRTTDGGATWTRQTNPWGSMRLQSVWFTDADTGTIVGESGYIFRTSNGGSTWVWQASGVCTNLFAVSFADENSAVCVGHYGVIIRSTDGGVTWTEQTEGTRNQLFDVCFTDSSTGTAVGCRGTIVHTTDGGETWLRQTSGTNSTLVAVSFTDQFTGTVVGYGGTILRTSDGGSTWEKQTSGTGNALHDVCLIDANTGIIVGTNGLILRTLDGGSTWEKLTSGTSSSLSAVSFVDEYTGTAVGLGTILRTADGGATWVDQSPGIFMRLYGVSFFDEFTGVAVGHSGADLDWGIILSTSNGGITWESCMVGPPLSDVILIDDARGWVVGNEGFVLRIDDGVMEISGVNNNLYGVSFPDSANGWAVGFAGTIIKRIPVE